MATLSEGNIDNLLLQLLREKVRVEIKADLMKVAEEQVDIAVDRAVGGLDMDIQRLFSERHAGEMVKVLVERVRR